MRPRAGVDFPAPSGPERKIASPALSSPAMAAPRRALSTSWSRRKSPSAAKIMQSRSYERLVRIDRQIPLDVALQARRHLGRIVQLLGRDQRAHRHAELA